MFDCERDPILLGPENKETTLSIKILWLLIMFPVLLVSFHGVNDGLMWVDPAFQVPNPDVLLLEGNGVGIQ